MRWILAYLDTHVVVWLYAGLTEKFNRMVRDLINEQALYVCPVVRLELQYLWEIQRVTDDADTIVADLATRIGLKVCDKRFDDVVTRAMALSWTRDPFDRLIVANASLDGDILISKDQDMLDNYPNARW
jgi:PIN domain nuclease of toxin-antitoxin system